MFKTQLIIFKYMAKIITIWLIMDPFALIVKSAEWTDLVWILQDSIDA